MRRRPLMLALVGAALFGLHAAIGLAADTSPNPHGRPEGFKQGGKPTYAVWHEDGVWNLRTTSKEGPMGKKGERTVFSGRVRVEGDRIVGGLQALEKAKKAKDADFITPHADGKGFDFRFATFGKSDGVNFKVGPKAESVTFRLLYNGDDEPKKIMIGAKGVQPAKAEFTLPAKPEK